MYTIFNFTHKNSYDFVISLSEVTSVIQFTTKLEIWLYFLLIHFPHMKIAIWITMFYLFKHNRSIHLIRKNSGQNKW